MKKNLISALFLVVFIFSVFGFSVANAADPADVAKVIELMFSDSIKGNGVILKKDYPNECRQVVFIKGGRRYTLYGRNNEEYLPFLSIWVRPEGSSGQKNVDTFNDNWLDGVVDLGIGGGDKKVYHSKDDLFAYETGIEFRKYWQEQYDKAIADALKTLK